MKKKSAAGFIPGSNSNASKLLERNVERKRNKRLRSCLRCEKNFDPESRYHFLCTHCRYYATNNNHL